MLFDGVNFSRKVEPIEVLTAKVFYDALIVAWIGSKVLHFIFGTILITYKMGSALTTTYIIKVLANSKTNVS